MNTVYLFQGSIVGYPQEFITYFAILLDGHCVSCVRKKSGAQKPDGLEQLVDILKSKEPFNSGKTEVFVSFTPPGELFFSPPFTYKTAPLSYMDSAKLTKMLSW